MGFGTAWGVPAFDWIKRGFTQKNTALMFVSLTNKWRRDVHREFSGCRRCLRMIPNIAVNGQA